MADFGEYQAAVEENGKRLRAFLDTFDHTIPEGLHEIVDRVDAEVWQEIDCMECARCCHVMTPTYSEDDIERISNHLMLSREEFIEEYLEESEDESGVLMHKENPCVFLKGNLCSIYDVRPENCKDFPYHKIRPFDEYNLTFIQNLEHCPATYLLVSKMEELLMRDYNWVEHME